jgi:hypothetical protein
VSWLTTIFFAFLAVVSVAFGWAPCCCGFIALICCPGTGLKNQLFATIIINGVTQFSFAINYNDPADFFGGTGNVWYGSVLKTPCTKNLDRVHFYLVCTIVGSLDLYYSIQCTGPGVSQGNPATVGSGYVRMFIVGVSGCSPLNYAGGTADSWGNSFATNTCTTGEVGVCSPALTFRVHVTD